MKLPASGRKPLDLCDYDVVIDSNQMYILHIDVYTLYLLAVMSFHFFYWPSGSSKISKDVWNYMDSLGSDDSFRYGFFEFHTFKNDHET